MRTWIKICGTTCVEDALHSVEAGADALGLIFCASKRQITPEQARLIVRELPQEVEKIGVFMDTAGEEIRRIVEEVGLTGIQMHGESDFPAGIYGSLPEHTRDRLRKIKTIPVREGFESGLDAYAAAAAGMVDAWLFDSGAGGGVAWDWRGARARLGERQGRFVIAGGLKPENVAEAVRVFRPWGVDAVSGVEREPRRKDPEKLKAFVAEVRRAEKT
jgi:phosphoribosylanthranilate isomerase